MGLDELVGGAGFGVGGAEGHVPTFYFGGGSAQFLGEAQAHVDATKMPGVFGDLLTERGKGLVIRADFRDQGVDEVADGGLGIPTGDFLVDDHARMNLRIAGEDIMKFEGADEEEGTFGGFMKIHTELQALEGEFVGIVNHEWDVGAGEFFGGEIHPVGFVVPFAASGRGEEMGDEGILAPVPLVGLEVAGENIFLEDDLDAARFAFPGFGDQ